MKIRTDQPKVPTLNSDGLYVLDDIFYLKIDGQFVDSACVSCKYAEKHCHGDYHFECPIAKSKREFSYFAVRAQEFHVVVSPTQKKSKGH